MAKKGSLGVIEFGDTPAIVGELRSWRQQSEAQEIDTTVMGTGNARFQPGAVREQIECDLFFEQADAGQVLILAQLANDTPQNVSLYPRGNTTGEAVFSGKAFVMNASTNADADGAIEMSTTFSFDENGGTWGTVP